ncbi:DUF3043 domain-containing protein [Bifidobacterium gallicum]|uniref:DUF3043 domain-containing protein n=1 Tax=Bifidobacterium gallicum DSM 20093 = LMG 11596 TaxID=561180 RepID=D1NU00_9BIFI|nr:DUF3043 domain-containing protein [Bifidobacterium gallicum]EFA23204.1 hypothetical protein BIFGAL_03321 [Bifidobacterium gallicum DSM 20093 = LMG 11596]
MAAKNEDTEKVSAETTSHDTQKKGRPTPKRKEAQAQNLRPLVPQDTKEQRKRAKQRLRERENREYEAMRTGDINNMPKAERLPWRVYIRDYVDSRFNIGEYFIPVALIILLCSVVFTVVWPNGTVSLIMMSIMYIYLFVIIIDVVVMWRKLKRQLIAKYGEQSVARGMRSGSYAWSRAIQLRRWRLPKPRYAKRSEYKEHNTLAKD